ncbi:MAG: Rpn family recombination-promoting nuclease/putative transposase [Azoarcus sp.]|jgi:predicted transposase/invertase (TIGR01784 family)|nr:Rpn family recombination-promoting nuclease/putative transposase [Azoarcus sp.]
MAIDILPPKYDEVFKMLFGDARNTDLLAAFLRAVLSLPEDDFDEIILKNPFLPNEILDDKTSILDILLQTKSGRQIDIEIQVANHAAFKSRILYYLARLFGNQIAEGDDYRLLKPVIGIVITDFDWIADSPVYHNVYRLYDSQTGSFFSDDLSLHTLELPKVGKEDDRTELWAWLEFLKAQNKETLEMLAKEHPAVRPAVTKLLRLSESEKARFIHEAREKARRDERARQYDAEERGWEKGRMEGRAEGREEERLVVARNLLERGMPVEEIVLITGLSREVVLAIEA